MQMVYFSYKTSPGRLGNVFSLFYSKYDSYLPLGMLPPVLSVSVVRPVTVVVRVFVVGRVVRPVVGGIRIVGVRPAFPVVVVVIVRVISSIVGFSTGQHGSQDGQQGEKKLQKENK